MPALQATLEDVRIQLPRSTNLRSVQSLLGQAYIAFCQIERSWRVWDTREDEESNQGHWNREDAVNDKQPSPSWHATNPGEIGVGSCLEIATNHGTKCIADEPGASTLEEFWA